MTSAINQTNNNASSSSLAATQTTPLLQSATPFQKLFLERIETSGKCYAKWHREQPPIIQHLTTDNDGNITTSKNQLGESIVARRERQKEMAREIASLAINPSLQQQEEIFSLLRLPETPFQVAATWESINRILPDVEGNVGVIEKLRYLILKTNLKTGMRRGLFTPFQKTLLKAMEVSGNLYTKWHQTYPPVKTEFHSHGDGEGYTTTSRSPLGEKIVSRYRTQVARVEEIIPAATNPSPIQQSDIFFQLRFSALYTESMTEREVAAICFSGNSDLAKVVSVYIGSELELPEFEPTKKIDLDERLVNQLWPEPSGADLTKDLAHLMLIANLQANPSSSSAQITNKDFYETKSQE